MMCQFSCSGDGDKVPNQLGLRSVHKAQRAEHTVSHRGSTHRARTLYAMCHTRSAAKRGARYTSDVALFGSPDAKAPRLATI